MGIFGYFVIIATASFGFGLAPRADASNIVFKNGTQMPDAHIVIRAPTFISVEVPSGTVRYPVSSIATIDGQPAVGGTDAVTEDPGTLSAPPEPTPSTAAATPTPQPETSPTPAPVAVPVAVTTERPVAPDRWNFELFLVGFLVFAGAWMRSLQAVQRDLFQKRVDPRHWTLAALMLPIAGAGAYFGWLRFQEKMGQFQSRRLKEAAANEGEDSTEEGQNGSAAPYTARRADPADYLAKKGATRRGLTFLDTDRQSISLNGNGEIASGLDNANEMLEEALLEKASDIHIEPGSDRYRVRFRLDGILHERMSYDTSDGVRLVTALKSLAEIDVAEKRRAQDGKFRVRAEDREVDFRVATATSIHGEKMVVRVLDHRGGIFDLTALGMSAEMLNAFQNVIHSRKGMILATGPTGSGKTSTLYAALRQLDATSLNLMSIEDPVEYELAGATQIAVNSRAGITYEAGLRSILRQDPDVILVGEMRDAEASAVALRAALTGHLVLSTLHTKDAIGTISRLQDMGIERYQLASALLMVVAQRLVRVLCPRCRREYPAVGNELESLGLKFDPGQPLYAAQGCDACLGTGFRGRTGLFELLVLDDDLRRVIGEGADEATLGSMALERGFKSFHYDGAEKILLGLTTVEEVLQAS